MSVMPHSRPSWLDLSSLECNLDFEKAAWNCVDGSEWCGLHARSGRWVPVQCQLALSVRVHGGTIELLHLPRQRDALAPILQPNRTKRQSKPELSWSPSKPSIIRSSGLGVANPYYDAHIHVRLRYSLSTCHCPF